MKLKQFPNIIFTSSKISDGNMSSKTGNKEEALLNRKKFFKKIRVPEESVAGVNQVHSTKVVVVDKEYLKKQPVDADSLITNTPGIYLMVKIADCLCIGLFDPKNKAIGLLHAGWPGLDKEIIKKTILEMQKNFGTNPQDLVVEISPSIGPCHYGSPLHLRQTKNPGWKKYITKEADENHGVDLWGFAENQLTENGVLKININNPKICTYESRDYFSHRRSVINSEPDFRFATVLGIKKS